MTSSIAKPAATNPVTSFLDNVGDTIKRALSGDMKLLDFEGSLDLKGGKFLVETRETILGKTFEQEPFELDPVVAVHVVASGIGGLLSKFFGKK